MTVRVTARPCPRQALPEDERLMPPIRLRLWDRAGAERRLLLGRASVRALGRYRCPPPRRERLLGSGSAGNGAHTVVTMPGTAWRTLPRPSYPCPIPGVPCPIPAVPCSIPAVPAPSRAPSLLSPPSSLSLSPTDEFFSQPVSSSLWDRCCSCFLATAPGRMAQVSPSAHLAPALALPGPVPQFPQEPFALSRTCSAT